MDDEIARAWRAIKAFRQPDAAFARVPNTVRQSAAETIEDLIRIIEIMNRRQHDTNWLQMGAFQILQDNDIWPSSAELISAYKRADKEKGPVARCVPALEDYH